MKTLQKSYRIIQEVESTYNQIDELLRRNVKTINGNLGAHQESRAWDSIYSFTGFRVPSEPRMGLNLRIHLILSPKGTTHGTQFTDFSSFESQAVRAIRNLIQNTRQ